MKTRLENQGIPDHKMMDAIDAAFGILFKRPEVLIIEHDGIEWYVSGLYEGGEFKVKSVSLPGDVDRINLRDYLGTEFVSGLAGLAALKYSAREAHNG